MKRVLYGCGTLQLHCSPCPKDFHVMSLRREFWGFPALNHDIIVAFSDSACWTCCSLRVGWAWGVMRLHWVRTHPSWISMTLMRCFITPLVSLCDFSWEKSPHTLLAAAGFWRIEQKDTAKCIANSRHMICSSPFIIWTKQRRKKWTGNLFCF